MTAWSGASTYSRTVDVVPTTPTASWELTALRHERLRTGAVLAPAAGPLWALVLHGVVTLETSGGTEPLCAGDAVWIDTTTAYRLTAADGAVLAVADLRLVVPPARVPSPLIVREFARQHSGVSELVRACPLGVECQRTLFAASYAGLIGAAMVAAWSHVDGPGAPAPADGADAAVAVVVAALAERPGEPWTVERMARLVHLSRSALAERFRREIGRTPSQVLRELRMQHARALLSDESRSVEQIGYAVGYGSIAAFSRAFSAHHRMAPQVWRATSSARRAEEGEAHAAGSREGGAQEKRRLDLVRVDDRPAHDGPERDRRLEGRHLHRHR